MSADDVQMYISFDPTHVDSTFMNISADLNAVYDWACKNGLKLNLTKTQFIMFSLRNISISVPRLYFGGEEVVLLNKVKDLGFVLNSGLGWTDHVSCIASKIYSGLRGLWWLSGLISRNTKLKLVKSLLIPHFTYGSVVFGDLTSTSKRILEMAFNACTRFVFGLSRYESTQIYRDKILGCSLFQYLDYRSCLFLFKLLVLKEPKYIHDNISYSISLRTSNLNLPRCHTSGMRSSFFVHGINVFNKLPTNIKKINTVNEFSLACRKHFNIN